MKRLFSALALSMLLALSGSQMCYAAEGQNVVTEFPQEISVEGGILKFVGMSEAGRARWICSWFCAR